MSQIKCEYDIEKTLNTMREKRLASGHTQKSLAELMGVDRTYISKWENRVSNPSFEHLVRLYRILHGLQIDKK